MVDTPRPNHTGRAPVLLQAIYKYNVSVDYQGPIVNFVNFALPFFKEGLSYYPLRRGFRLK